METETITFKDKWEFTNYIDQKLPKDIWLDSFSKDSPYISVKYKNGLMVGAYNHQCLLTHEISRSQELFEEGMYIKK